MIQKVLSYGLRGIEAVPVTVECEVADGGIGVHIVGIPDQNVRFAIPRIMTAIRAAGYRFPGSRIVVNVAPALSGETDDLDLPIALAIIGASGQADLIDGDRTVAAGRFSDGQVLREVHGGCCAVQMALRKGFDTVILPPRAAAEETLPDDDEVTVYGAGDLEDAVQAAEAHDVSLRVREGVFDALGEVDTCPLVDKNTLAVLEVAAAGGFDVLTDTSTFSDAFVLRAILPKDPGRELIAKAVFSAAGEVANYHSHSLCSLQYYDSAAAIRGDMSRPGRMSLAYNGVLTMDLRQAWMEHDLDTIARIHGDGIVRIWDEDDHSAEYPAGGAIFAIAPSGMAGTEGLSDAGGEAVTRFVKSLRAVVNFCFGAENSLERATADDILAARERVAAAYRRRKVREWKVSLGEPDPDESFPREDLDGLTFDVARTVADLQGCEAVDRTHVEQARRHLFRP